MNRSITHEIRPSIQHLDAYFRRSDVFDVLKNRGTSLCTQISILIPYAVAAIDLKTLPIGIPEEVGSIRVAVFFPDMETKIERHPNSRQFLFSLSGQGETRVWQNGGIVKDQYGTGIKNKTLEAAWHLVETNVWHQSIGRGKEPWVLVALHTAKEVLDEYQE